ncbi:peroxidase A2 [Selaginella moellendorffii]|uniref:peroxidase A2 n=1 Tax=Selaginella moellendorffii TaxID=88036 RepID=UPI000D1C32B2|nr:peroxidase A2 [Selaginella moellendorffii]|eukprot:XP_002987837.2 peroxidase A2 [Selaginella moellendorffii]
MLRRRARYGARVLVPLDRVRDGGFQRADGEELRQDVQDESSPGIQMLKAAAKSESNSCPQVFSIVRQGVDRAFSREQRLAASLLRLHFHDCFVNGCDASILLDDTSTFTGEKTAGPNLNSARGFDVIDDIKSELENQCPGIVSCADILALAARDSVTVSAGPSWDVLLGRRDSFRASQADANRFIPSPASDVPALVSAFQAVGLSASNMIVLSGAHTIGAARCGTLTPRLYNQSGTGQPDSVGDPDFLASLQRLCPPGGNPGTLSRLDVRSPQAFDNSYYQNLLQGRGVLHSDQILFSGGGSSAQAVQDLSSDENLFFGNFAASMVRLGSIAPLTFPDGEIRTNCRFTNS